ncbi:MAG: ferrous iron transport protein B, partial [Candidatus Cloacimonadota bacterium]
MSKMHVIALVGNPNVGKTTLFNALTGSRQTVGNWPGVTVEHKSGYFYHEQQKLELIDLPGIYSLSASSPDEQVSRDFIINQKPDLIINIVDASNLERNLYLTTQLMEMRVPMMIVFSMTDIAEQNGVEIDYKHLVSHLGFDAIPLQLNKKHDLDFLIGRIQENLHLEVPIIEIRYDEIVEQEIASIEEHLKKAEEPVMSSYRWTALKLIEEDSQVQKLINPATLEEISVHIRNVSKHRRQPGPAVIADDRYGFIRGLVKDVVQRKRKSPYTFSDKVDQLVLNTFLGMPIFFFVMYLVFLVAVRFSQPFVELIDTGLSFLFVEQFGLVLESMNLPGWLRFIFTEGLGGGITTIGTFIPPIFFIYVSLSILEDSGYMARAAFLADKFMRKIGLPGKAFIPLLVGFGCTVPAIMAT